jgi:hypothetical protein
MTDRYSKYAGHTTGPWAVFIDDTGDQWTGWPLSIDAVNETDKCVVRTGGQWPHEWDAKTSQHEAVANAYLIADAPTLLAENKRLRKALEELGVALRTDSLQKTITGDAVEYHLDGSRMYHAINAVRAALKGDQP